MPFLAQNRTFRLGARISAVLTNFDENYIKLRKIKFVKKYARKDAQKKSSRKSFRRNAKLIMSRSRKLKAAALRFLTRFRRFRTKKTAALSFSALTRKMILRFVAFTMLLTLSRTFRNSACRWNLRLMLCVPRPHCGWEDDCVCRDSRNGRFSKALFLQG